MTERKPYVRETRQGRLLQLEEENKKLKSENEQLKKDKRDLKLRNEVLRRQNEEFKEKTVPFLEKVNKVSAEQNQKLKKDLERLKNELNQKIEQLTKEKKVLFEKLRDYKEKLLLDLQRHGEVCAKNCILCVTLGICKRKLGFSLCGPQLVLVIFMLAAERNKKEDLKCEKMLELFENCKIVRVAAQYDYPVDEEAKQAMMDEAWDNLMTMDGRECILGIKNPLPLGGGHCVEVDLESRRTEDGNVMMYDPKAPDVKSANMSKAEFTNYIEDAEGLRFYTVDLERLKQIVDEHRKILHFTDDQPFFHVTSDV